MWKVTKVFMSANIPLYNLHNKHIKNQFYKTGDRLPSETACSKTVLRLSTNELERIRNAVHDKQIFFCY